MVIPVIRGGNSRIGLNRRNKGDEERAGSEIGATKGPPVSQREGASSGIPQRIFWKRNLLQSPQKNLNRTVFSSEDNFPFVDTGVGT